MAEGPSQTARCVLPLEHPSYAGHFPGNPIVAGVLLLDLVVAEVNRGAPRAVESVKFTSALKPGEVVDLAWRSAGLQTRFRCERDGQVIAEGSLQFPEST